MMNKRIFVLFLSLLTMNITAQIATKRAKEYNLENKLALKGYDGCTTNCIFQEKA